MNRMTVFFTLLLPLILGACGAVPPEETDRTAANTDISGRVTPAPSSAGSKGNPNATMARSGEGDSESGENGAQRAGNGVNSERDDNGDTEPGAEPGAEPSADWGDELWVTYEDPGPGEYQALYRSLQRSDFYGDVAADINAMLVLPSEVGVYFDTCDEANAFYDPEYQEILMCYELVSEYLDLETEGSRLQSQEYDDAVINASLFTFFHELGHALVDVLALPVTGREEDVVDEFATLLLLWWEDEAAVLAGAEQFAAEAVLETEEVEAEDYPYWGEHGLSAQRYYNVLCLIYGSDPRYWRDLVQSRDLPRERAELCPEEFEQKTYAWETLLDPYWE